MYAPKPDFQTPELLHDTFLKISAWWHMKRCSALLIIRGKVRIKTTVSQDFPGGAVDKNPPASGGDMGSIPDPGIPHASEQVSPCTWTWAVGRKSHNYWAPEMKLLKHVHPRAHALTQEKPPQGEAHTTQQRVARLITTRESPHTETKSSPAHHN